MREQTLFKEFSQYVILNICGMVGLSCYILADTFFIANSLGADGLTALNLAIPVYSFVHGSGLMLGMGGATKYAIYRGQKKTGLANRVFTDSLYLAAAAAFLFMTAGVLFSSRLTSLLGADSDIFPMTKTYIQVILLFAPAFLANDCLLCFVRNDGNPRLSMAAMLIGSFSNILLDYIFLFPLQMGIFGAVLATGIAPVISMSMIAIHWIANKNTLCIEKVKPLRASAKQIIALGFPSLITEVASGIVMIVFNMIIKHLQGNIGIAAYGVVANLSLVVSSIYTGIAQGTQPLFGRFYGRGDNKKIKQLLNYALAAMFSLSVIIFLIFFAAADPIACLFNREQNPMLQQFAVVGLKLYFTALPFAGFNIILSTYFTSREWALPAQITSLAKGLIVIVPMAFLMSSLFQMTGVWLSYPLTEGVVAITGYLWLRRLDRP